MIPARFSPSAHTVCSLSSSCGLHLRLRNALKIQDDKDDSPPVAISELSNDSIVKISDECTSEYTGGGEGADKPCPSRPGVRRSRSWSSLISSSPRTDCGKGLPSKVHPGVSYSISRFV